MRPYLLRAGAVLALIGGTMMVIGPFLRWAAVDVDIAAFARILGERPPQVHVVVDDTATSLTWLEADRHGDVAVSLALTVIVLAVFALSRPGRWLGLALAVGGAGVLLLARIAEPDVASLLERTIATAAPWATAVGVDPHALSPSFTIEVGNSLRVSAVGGALAVAGGCLLLVFGGEGREAR
jgi:hypothetical protein